MGQVCSENQRSWYYVLQQLYLRNILDEPSAYMQHQC